MQSKKNLGLKELIAIAVGSMVGGGIFTILGISVSMVGALAPFAIALGGVVAWFAAYCMSNWVFTTKMKVPPTPFTNAPTLLLI